MSYFPVVVEVLLYSMCVSTTNPISLKVVKIADFKHCNVHQVEGQKKNEILIVTCITVKK